VAVYWIAITATTPELEASMLLLVRSIFGGIIAVLLTWIVILITWYVWVSRKISNQPGLRAVVGGWDMLLHTPFVLLLLTLAFGLWLVARRDL
jgi:hypothetical protein